LRINATKRRGLAIIEILVAACSAFFGARAQEMTLTIYDDGKAYPGGCDAHVVVNPSDNGTRFAFDPASSRPRPQKCRPRLLAPGPGRHRRGPGPVALGPAVPLDR
jgi:hypothetical protein